MTSPRNPRRASFVMLPKDILARTDLRPTAKLVYAFLVDAMRGKGRAWPGVRTMCVGIGVTDKAVTGAIAQLERAGFIEVERRERGRSNIYRLPKKRRRESDTLDPMSARETPALEVDRSVGVSGGSVGESPAQAPEEVRRKKTRPKKKTTRRCARGAQNKSNPKCARTKPSKPCLSGHQQVVDYFTARWNTVVGGGASYRFNGPRDGKAAKTILVAVGGDVSRSKAIVDRYLSDSDPWLMEHGVGRGLSLLASGVRLAKYIAATADRNHVNDNGRVAATEHPVVAEARGRWPEDVAEHPEAWKAVAETVESGRLSIQAVKKSKSKTGAEFRASLNSEAATNVG